MPSGEDQDDDGLRARSGQAIEDLAQALLDNPMFESALSAASGARDKALEAQRAALSALNLPAATDVERLQRRLRLLSQRLEDVEEQMDRLAGEVAILRRESASQSDVKGKG